MKTAIWSGICTAALFSATVAIAAQQPPSAGPTATINTAHGAATFDDITTTCCAE